MGRGAPGGGQGGGDLAYPGVGHASNNDTSAERYNKEAAIQAWGRTTAFLYRYLDA